MTFYRFRSFVARDRFLIGAALLRISIGLIVLYQYLIHYGQRHFLFSSSGISVFSDDFKKNVLSLYNLSDSLLYFDIIYHLSIVTSVIYLLGYKGRIFTLINFIFYYSLSVRYGHISDGGDNLLIICMFLLIFSNSTAYFSLDSARFNLNKTTKENTFIYQLSSIFHNFSVLFCIIQLCILYFFSGAYQLMGELWQNGTAIYYISQVKEFSRPILRHMVNEHLWLTIFATYFSMIIKLAFPFSIFNKTLKPFIVAAMVAFHVGIAIGMGLLTFSLIMIMTEFLVFTDNEYRKTHQKFIQLIRRLHMRLRRTGRSLGRRWLAPFRLIVFYDNWCPMCRSIMRITRRIDYFGLLIYIGFRDSEVIKRYNLNPQEVEKKMHSIKATGSSTMKSGIHSVVQICSRLVPLWIIVPFLYISSKVGIGSLVYNYIASNRKLLPVNHCDEYCQIKYNPE